ncbi:hypothetical protein [Saccharopolyspora sp. 6V]|uniref:phage terminase small subunit n=1 Tax=Saccharopolyspora sp. 6V TaxID=2877239 RepID=UPI001CD36FA7|nr:hypothetical protein [Saccharopolyspora sp. 6V]MCA1191626.1 hypothetical protein [Saccharopolyspora sp. 6V]
MAGAPGRSGRTPKRSTQRHGHRSKEEAAVQKAPGASSVEVPESDAEWHPIAQRWFASLGQSGESQFYEPSDWAQAEYLAELMSRSLTAEKTSAMLVSAVLSGTTSLLVTEGDRRRLKLELQRVRVDEDEEVADATVTDLTTRFSS